MSFSINLGLWNSVFAVPCALVDQHIKLAGSLQLKVLLWLLRHAGEDSSEQDISSALGANIADIKDAMSYWIETGLIAVNPETQTFSPNQAINREENGIFPEQMAVPCANEELFTEESEEEKLSATVGTEKVEPIAKEKKEKHEAIHRLPKPDGLFIAERINQSKEIGFMMQESQQILGRPISPGLSSTLLMLHDDYGLPADVILMLLQYVKGCGKDNTSYIESVGRNWAQEGIFTHEKVEEKLRMLDEVSRAWRTVEQTLGISHRSPSAREEQYAKRWILEWKFSHDMLREAYERCVNSTGKLNLSYINRILERWQKHSIFTPQQAALEQEEKGNRQANEHQTTYDIDEYERMTASIPDSLLERMT